ncbi:hypothetical protein [Salinibaculum salinum]|uniref:hypothetical protein n=1 Tax=Salinibaculum salinum TaxID=3131996 RepID=UPI0030EDE766
MVDHEEDDTTEQDDVFDSLPEDPGDAPAVTCSRCGRSWELDYELDDLKVGNRALEQFALDHHRHTGHFPDDVTPWIADCRNCPDEERFLSEQPARRWAETHTRHTRHSVSLQSPTDHTEEVVWSAE